MNESQSKPTWGYYIDCPTSTSRTKWRDFKSFKVYSAYKEYGFKELRKKDFVDSFTGQFLNNNFEVYKIVFNDITPSFHIVKHKDFNPTCNWFGVSLYSPDVLFVRGNKIITMSLQGCNAKYNEKYAELFEAKSIKYISIKEGDSIIYETWTGELPPQELINKFIK